MLTALRAAAIVVIATGLNDVIASAVPRYEPLYLYLAAIALVTWLDGLLLGAFTAVAAAGFYALLFLPRAGALSPHVYISIGYAAAALLAGGVVRALTRGQRRHTPPPEFFAPPPPQRLTAGNVVVDNAEVLSAIDELRAELRAELRMTVVTEEGRREEAEERALALERALSDANATAAELRRTLDGERTLRPAAAERLAELEQLAAGATAARTRLREVEHALESARLRAAE
ncbi:MAG TPA: hypothetical protein VE010_22910, partial [Thermoanaerobaculia bacterium]|nr:hypothetical protein [Thermoanaerobaculia bacterium]